MAKSVTGITGNKYFLDTPKGKGSVAVVFRARDKNGSLVVAKQYSGNYALFTDKIDELKCAGIITLHNQPGNPGLVSILDYTDPTKASGYIIMDLVSGHNLGEFLSCQMSTRYRLTAKEIDTIFVALAKALYPLGKRGLVHNDLKPQNIIYDRKRLTIIDYDTVCLAGSAEPPKCDGWGHTLLYSSPDSIDPETDKSSFAAQTGLDVWAIGLIVLDLARGQFWILDNIVKYDTIPETPTTVLEAIKEFLNAKTVSGILKSLSISPKAKKLIKGCLQFDPEKRITLETILKAYGV